MKKFLVLAASIGFLTACEKERISGSGSTITEIRTVPVFTGVRIEGSAKATLLQGGQQKVEVKGYENLVPIYETVVRNSVLVLKFNKGYNSILNNNIEVFITVDNLTSASINGSGEINFSNFNGNSIEVEINGSGDILASNCQYIASRLITNGSGYIRARNLIAKRATASIQGSGKIDLTGTDEVDATIQGSGNINYWGNPAAVITNVNGSGQVRKM